ncbi:MAG: hypothetical protein ACPG1C_10805 [Alphaproteobacteria bacterium]
MKMPILVRLLEAMPGHFVLKCALLFIIGAAPVLVGSLFWGELSRDYDIAPDDIYGMLIMSMLLTVLLVYAVGSYAALLRRAGGKLDDGATGEILAGIVGILISLAAPFLEASEVGWSPYDISAWHWESGHHRILVPIIGWHLARGSYFMVTEARKISKRILAEASFDLFDPVPLQASVRQGLLNVAIIAGFAAMLSPFLIDPRYYGMVGTMAPITLIIASIGFILPAFGVARRIRTEKETALAQLAPEIATRRKTLSRLQAGAPQWPQFAQELESLIAYRKRIEAVREWPFDRSAFSRLGLYMLIPVASWVGAALVEQIVESVL